ncbi:MAG TPA: DNA replication/repair protein RecF [Dongiaceae bacterium]|nr:DNA replication/repair protein RecF [Dongiaceae bacterium]
MQQLQAAVPARAAAAQGPAGVALLRLDLSDFRCYVRATVEVDARPVVATGPNGAGKTNLLEAISFLAPGRGLRHARLCAVDRRAPAATANAAPRPWAVAARLARPEGVIEIGTGRDPAAERPRRAVKIDGAFVRGPAAFADLVGVLWLTPDMDRLFLDGPAERRRFLDRLVYGFDPDHAARVAAYDHALRERARLLRDARRAGEAGWLAALEEQMAARGVAIAAARRDLVSRLQGAIAAGVGRFPRPGLGVEGAVERWLDTMPALAAEEALRDRLAAARRHDAETGGAAWGPHRSDFAVTHLGRGLPAAECSTGEQKALLIAVVLAQARLQAAVRGAPPVLLLDEVAAHLDAVRRAALFDEILALGAQAWLTGTDEALFAPLGDDAQFLRVRDAAIARS